jgi:uncharacterized membrane protein (DUF106 family)
MIKKTIENNTAKTILEMLEDIEQKQFHKKLEDIRLESEKQEMLLIKAKAFKENSKAIMYCFICIPLFYFAVVLVSIVVKILR